MDAMKFKIDNNFHNCFKNIKEILVLAIFFLPPHLFYFNFIILFWLFYIFYLFLYIFYNQCYIYFCLYFDTVARNYIVLLLSSLL